MSLARKVFRNKAKVAYKQFEKEWRVRNAEQKSLAASEGKEYRKQHMPTFSEFVDLIERGMKQRKEAKELATEQAAQKDAEEFKEPEDLEWTP